MPAVSIRHCAACGDERPFEQPPCVDGHGDLCPELACAECGAAILLAPLAPLTPWPVEPMVERLPMLPVRAA
ncbi:MAG: hypothetical protein ACRDOO_28035 [Actinomadura sp.]